VERRPRYIEPDFFLPYQDLGNYVYVGHYEQLLSDIHFLSYHLKLSVGDIKAMKWYERKSLIEFHAEIMERSKQQK